MKEKALYQDFETHPITGTWRPASAERTLDVIDRFTGEILLSRRMAILEDLDEAYRAAEKVQPEWAAMAPTARGEVMHRAAEVFDARKEEILD